MQVSGNSLYFDKLLIKNYVTHVSDPIQFIAVRNCKCNSCLFRLLLALLAWKLSAKPFLQQKRTKQASQVNILLLVFFLMSKAFYEIVQRSRN